MLGVLCASIGSIMVTEAIKLITGIGDPLIGRLMVYDALDMSYKTLNLRKDPAGEPITELIDYDGVLRRHHRRGRGGRVGSHPERRSSWRSG